MIDPKRQCRVELAERVVGELGQMHHGLHPTQIGLTDAAHVSANRGEVRCAGIVQTALAVETGVEPYDVMSPVRKERGQQDADVSVRSSDEDLHRTLACRAGGAVSAAWAAM